MQHIIEQRPYALEHQEPSRQIQQLEEMIGEDLIHLFRKFQVIETIANPMVQDEERRALAQEVDIALMRSQTSYNLALFQFGFILTLCRTHEMHRFITVEGVEAESFDHWLSLRKADVRSVAFAERAYKHLTFVVAEIGREALEVLPAINDDSLKAIAHARQQAVRQTKQEVKQMPGFESMSPQEQNQALQEIQKKQEHVVKAAVISAIQSPREYNRQFMNSEHGIVTKVAIPCNVIFHADGSKATLKAEVTREQLEHEIGDGHFFFVFNYNGHKDLHASQLKELLEDEDLTSQEFLSPVSPRRRGRIST